MEFTQGMRLAIREAEASLREGNNGFGAVILKDGEVVACAHDREVTCRDATSHAEMNAIREASGVLGKKLRGCTLVCTHEPCPMCAFAVVWAGIERVVYGYSIKDAIAQGRKRIDYPCAEAFRMANADIEVQDGVMQAECEILYRKDVRAEIERLRGADDRQLDALNEDSIQRRTKWFRENRDGFTFLGEHPLDAGYRLLLERFRITPSEAPVVERTEDKILFHSMNFCPTLEACRILGLDTRQVCRRLNEGATDALVKQVDGRLRFSRNYDRIRPYSDFCEEFISMES